MWPSIVPRTTIDGELIRLLRDLRTRAQNARGSVHDALLSDYRLWADDAYRRLRPNFDDTALGRLVRTQTFWALGDVNPLDTYVKRLAGAELDDIQSRFGHLIEEYELFERRWREVCRIIVLDTSAVMALGNDLLSANWFALINRLPDMQLRLVLPLVAIDELDNLKDRGNNTAKAEARTALKLLEPQLLLWDGPTELPEVKHQGWGRAFIEPLSDPPDHRRLPSADDEIISQAAMLKGMTGYETRVATRDTGMLLRVRDAGLTGCRVEPL